MAHAGGGLNAASRDVLDSIGNEWETLHPQFYNSSASESALQLPNGVVELCGVGVHSSLSWVTVSSTI